MRLIIDGRRLGPLRTGVGRYLEGLLEEWAEIGPPMAETIVVLHDPAGKAFCTRIAGIQSIVIGRNWPGLVWERWGLGRILKPGDLLFAPTNLVPANWRSYTVLVAFDTLQDAVPDSFSRLVRLRFGARYRRASKSADCVIAPSEATARDLIRHHGVDPGRIRVVLPAPGPLFRPQQASRIGPYILFVGKRSKRRNIAAMVAGFERVRNDRPDFQLVFAGPDRLADDFGPDHASRGLVDAGHVAESDLPGLMSGAVALLYLSDYEGFGLPIAEAMACGSPVITLRNSALTEAGGEAAIYLESADPGAIRAAIVRLLEDSTYRSERIDAGLRWVGRWTRRQFAEAVKEVLIEIAARMRSDLGQ